MKIHLIRSEEVSKDKFRMIVSIVKQSVGPIEFIVRDEDISREDGEENDPAVADQESGEVAKHLVRRPWSELFKRCEQYRELNNKVKESDLVVLFTDYANEENWFSSWDESGKLNFFIQTSGWEDFVESEECYPVVYELATLPLFLSVCGSLKEVKAMAHYDRPRGCPFDFCEYKTDVRLKLRTGDVCPDCTKKMIECNLDPAVARQVFKILDHIRSQMLFRNSFALTKQLSRLEVSTFHRELRFTDIGNQTVSLSAREITVYLFFLNHPKGLYFNYIPQHQDEIIDIYRKFSHEATIAAYANTLKSLIYNEKHTLSQVISKIKKKISDTVGDDLAPHYIIEDEKRLGKHRIPLDRKLVSFPKGDAYYQGS
ncbi:MAG TPA: hypothetical protein PLB27_16450 [Bacteroidales bacterium]|mgnify:CR=1 FL=1|nr:hypothetical protein [Bacteroidales bacterium]